MELPLSSQILLQKLYFEFSGRCSSKPQQNNEFYPINDPLLVSVKICSILSNNNISYAIGGAIAFNCYCKPRKTNDIDMYLFIEVDILENVLNILKENLEKVVLTTDPYSYVLNGWAFPIIINDVKVDILLPFANLCKEAEKTRKKYQILHPYDDCWILSPEILCILKILYYRQKDLKDVEKLLLLDDLNIKYIKTILEDILIPNNLHSRLNEFDKITKKINSNAI